MNRAREVACVLCQGSDETKITGALSTKDEVTAHQNCLFFSSGIYCQDSPHSDDLFGFSVEDVLNEVKRGNKLICNKCKRKGATAGCEVKRCKKSYHYPCAVQEGAKIIEETDEGRFGIYCNRHHQQSPIIGSVSSKPQTSKNPIQAGSSKVYCLACEKTEGNISLESLSKSIILLYCETHAPPSHKMNTNRPSANSSDSSSSCSVTPLPSKRRGSVNDKEEDTPSKRKSEGWKRRISDSNSDEKVPSAEIDIFAPLDFDPDESANSVPESQLIRKATGSPTGSPTGSTSANPLKDEGSDGEDETTIDSDAESESLLHPLQICTKSESLSPPRPAFSAQAISPAHPSRISVKESAGEGSSPQQSPVHSSGQHTTGPSVPQQTDHSKPRSVTGSPPCTSLAPSEIICASHLSSPLSLEPPPELSIDSTSFWKSCNLAGCTQAIFTGFINEMNYISSRIQSDQASQKDYDLALTVMSASGKLAELVAKQQKELQRKQMELQEVAAAMKDIVSALRR